MEDQTKFYIQHEPLNIKSNNFIDFDLQSRRPSFNKSNNLRSIMVAPFIRPDIKNKSMSNFRSTNMKIDINKVTMENNQNNHINEDADRRTQRTDREIEMIEGQRSERRSEREMNNDHSDKPSGSNTPMRKTKYDKFHLNNTLESDKIDQGSTKYGSMIKSKSQSSSFMAKSKSTTFLTNLKGFESKPKKHESFLLSEVVDKQALNKLPVPDFRKIVSREKYYKIHEPKVPVYGYIIPNRKSVEPSKLFNIIFRIKV